MAQAAQLEKQRCTLFVIFHCEALNGWNQTEHSRILQYYGTNPRFDKHFTEGATNPIVAPLYEYELPVYDDYYQANLYKDNSIFFHLLKNWHLLAEKPECEFMGVLQGDMTLDDAMIESLSRGTSLDSNKIFVYCWPDAPSKDMWNMNWMHYMVDDFFEQMVETFTWSQERPRPATIDSVNFSKLYFYNFFIAHRRFVRRLVDFFARIEPIIRRWRSTISCPWPNNFASFLERVTCLWFIMLEMSEDGRALTFEPVSNLVHTCGYRTTQTDRHGTRYK